LLLEAAHLLIAAHIIHTHTACVAAEGHNDLICHLIVTLEFGIIALHSVRRYIKADFAEIRVINVDMNFDFIFIFILRRAVGIAVRVKTSSLSSSYSTRTLVTAQDR
jgi:hypothetical protein